jgi:hypothetical protein
VELDIRHEYSGRSESATDHIVVLKDSGAPVVAIETKKPCG